MGASLEQASSFDISDEFLGLGGKKEEAQQEQQAATPAPAATEVQGGVQAPAAATTSDPDRFSLGPFSATGDFGSATNLSSASGPTSAAAAAAAAAVLSNAEKDKDLKFNPKDGSVVRPPG